MQKSQATRSLEAENRRQAQTLFGVVALFALSHVFRVVLNVHEIYLTSSFNGKLGHGCASNIPFWTHVCFRYDIQKCIVKFEIVIFTLYRNQNYYNLLNFQLF